MPYDKDARAKAENHFDQARRATSEAARSIIDAEHAATLKKTQRLREQRLAKDAQEKGAKAKPRRTATRRKRNPST